MKAKVDITELRQKNAELLKKACIFTNLAYSLVEVADTIMLDVNSLLNTMNAGVSREEIRKYKNVRSAGKTFKIWLADLAKHLYKIDNAAIALDDADALYDILLLITDRCGGDINKIEQIKSILRNQFKSQYNYYK